LDLRESGKKAPQAYDPDFESVTESGYANECENASASNDEDVVKQNVFSNESACDCGSAYDAACEQMSKGLQFRIIKLLSHHRCDFRAPSDRLLRLRLLGGFCL
jgi:hypothetical protein